MICTRCQCEIASPEARENVLDSSAVLVHVNDALCAYARHKQEKRELEDRIRNLLAMVGKLGEENKELHKRLEEYAGKQN